jgi:hypothetical protein
MVSDREMSTIYRNIYLERMFNLPRLSLPILQALKVTKLLKKTAKCDKSMVLVYKYRQNPPILASC